MVPFWYQEVSSNKNEQGKKAGQSSMSISSFSSWGIGNVAAKLGNRFRYPGEDFMTTPGPFIQPRQTLLQYKERIVAIPRFIPLLVIPKWYG